MQEQTFVLLAPHGEMDGRTGRILGCLQTREPAILKFSDNNHGIWGHFYNFYLLKKCLKDPYHASYSRSQEEGVEWGSSLQEPPSNEWKAKTMQNCMWPTLLLRLYTQSSFKSSLFLAIRWQFAWAFNTSNSKPAT